ncbi:hypothetical protein BBJ28_00003787 [Nothophytophthora sp. Chile5]|nr:hypothetical protein BBJ28_00003787 [Nothophytophthora sp. Chile5]
MTFRLPLDAHMATVPAAAGMALSPSRELIVHPLAPSAGGALSPEARVAAEWLQAHYGLPSPLLVEAKAVASSPKRPLALLDDTCDENVGAILSFLDGASLCAARGVCRSWHRLGADEHLWFDLCLAEFHVSPAQLRTRPESYQKLYQLACRSIKLLIRDFFEEQCLTNLQNSLRIPRAAALTMIAARSGM